MSGSGSGTGGGYMDVGGSADCSSLIVVTQIASPDEVVLAGVVPGEVLDVAATNSRGVIVVAVLRGGRVAGGFASTKLQTLRECIEKGYSYVADVLAVDGLRVQVRVRPR